MNKCFRFAYCQVPFIRSKRVVELGRSPLDDNTIFPPSVHAFWSWTKLDLASLARAWPAWGLSTGASDWCSNRDESQHFHADLCVYSSRNIWRYTVVHIWFLHIVPSVDEAVYISICIHTHTYIHTFSCVCWDFKYTRKSICTMFCLLIGFWFSIFKIISQDESANICGKPTHIIIFRGRLQ